MPEVDWSKTVEAIEPHIVRILTPRGSGTGFLIKTQSFYSIATAAHVINHSHYWEEPIRIQHFSSREWVLLHSYERAIILDETQDSAIILLSNQGSIAFPADMLPLGPQDKYVRVGV